MFELPLYNVPEDVKDFERYGVMHHLSHGCLDVVAKAANIPIDFMLIAYLFENVPINSWILWIRRHMTFNKEETMWMLEQMHAKIGWDRFTGSGNFAVYMKDLKGLITNDEMIDLIIKYEIASMMFSLKDLVDKVPKRYLMFVLNGYNPSSMRYLMSSYYLDKYQTMIDKVLDFTEEDLLVAIDKDPECCSYMLQASPNLVVNLNHIIEMRRQDKGVKSMLALLSAYKEKLTVAQALDLFMNRKGYEDKSENKFNNRPPIVKNEKNHLSFLIQ